MHFQDFFVKLRFTCHNDVKKSAICWAQLTGEKNILDSKINYKKSTIILSRRPDLGKILFQKVFEYKILPKNEFEMKIQNISQNQRALYVTQNLYSKYKLPNTCILNTF